MPAKVTATLKVLREISDRVGRVEGQMVVHGQQLALHSEMFSRLATEITAMAATIVDVRNLLANRLDQRDRVADHETRIRELERKTA